MTRAEFNTWLAALRSGEYEQGRRLLRSSDNLFCCLGVFLDAVKKVPWELAPSGKFYYPAGCEGSSAWLPEEFVEGSFYNGCAMSLTKASLATLNDAGGYTFDVIANLLEKNPEDYVIIQEEETPS